MLKTVFSFSLPFVGFGLCAWYTSDKPDRTINLQPLPSVMKLCTLTHSLIFTENISATFVVPLPFPTLFAITIHIIQRRIPKRQQSETPSNEKKTQNTGRRLIWVLLGGMAVVGGVVGLERF
jgi:hypothetical protein